MHTHVNNAFKIASPAQGNTPAKGTTSDRLKSQVNMAHSNTVGHPFLTTKDTEKTFIELSEQEMRVIAALRGSTTGCTGGPMPGLPVLTQSYNCQSKRPAKLTKRDVKAADVEQLSKYLGNDFGKYINL